MRNLKVILRFLFFLGWRRAISDADLERGMPLYTTSVIWNIPRLLVKIFSSEKILGSWEKISPAKEKIFGHRKNLGSAEKFWGLKKYDLFNGHYRENPCAGLFLTQPNG